MIPATVQTAFVCNVFPDDNKGGAEITSQTIQAVKRAYPDATVFAIPTQVKNRSANDTHRFTLRSHEDVEFLAPIVTEGRGPFSGFRAFLHSLRLLVGDPKKSSNSTVREIAVGQVVVSKGGYVFVHRKSIRRLLGFWLTVFPLIVAKRAGVRTVAIGATVGPFENWYSRYVTGWVLRQVDSLVVRDPYSYDEAIALGISPDRITTLPDVVFAHPPISDEDVSKARVRFIQDRHRFAAIALATGDLDNAFHRSLDSVLREVLQKHIVDRVLVVVQSVKDEGLSRQFVDRIADERVVLIREDLSPHELMALYGGAEFVIARRMHAAIFAMVAGAPTLACVKYGKKVQGVMASLGLEKYLVDYPIMSHESLLHQVVDIVENGPDVRRATLEAVDRARADLRDLEIRIAGTNRRTEGTGLLWPLLQ